jgi:hypothetical protein
MPNAVFERRLIEELSCEQEGWSDDFQMEYLQGCHVPLSMFSFFVYRVKLDKLAAWRFALQSNNYSMSTLLEDMVFLRTWRRDGNISWNAQGVLSDVFAQERNWRWEDTVEIWRYPTPYTQKNYVSYLKHSYAPCTRSLVPEIMQWLGLGGLKKRSIPLLCGDKINWISMIHGSFNNQSILVADTIQFINKVRSSNPYSFL